MVPAPHILAPYVQHYVYYKQILLCAHQDLTQNIRVGVEKKAMLESRGILIANKILKFYTQFH